MKRCEAMMLAANVTTSIIVACRMLAGRFVHAIKRENSLLWGLALVSLFFTHSSSAARQPNIIFIIADDIGWTDLQPYNDEGKIPTPYINRLANEGMRFTDAHSTSALCSPSRYSLLTGNYPWRGRQPAGTWHWSNHPQILKEQRTIAHAMQKAGYRTALLGKLHQGAEFARNTTGKPDLSRPITYGPKQWGFEYSYTLLSGHQGAPYAFFENNQLAGNPAALTTLQPGVYGNSKIETAGVGLPDWDSSRVAETLLQKMQQFIQQDPDKPFYIHLNTDAAHSPFTPPKQLLGTPIAGTTKLPLKADMIYMLDVTVGKIIEILTTTGQLSNTLIVLTSDNGGTNFAVDYGHDSTRGIRGEKSFLTEGGHRVPLIAWWPSHIPAGAIRKQVIGNHDMIPTFIDIAQTQTLQGQCLDAISFKDVLLGKTDDLRPLRNSLLIDSGPGRGPFAAYADEHSPNGSNNSNDKIQIENWRRIAKKWSGSASHGLSHALRDGKWKMLFDIENDRQVALYNLDLDPEEMHNILYDHNNIAQTEKMALQYRRIRDSSNSSKISSAR